MGGGVNPVSIKKSEFKWFKTNSNNSKLWPIRKVASLAWKIEIKIGFQDLEEMNYFLHRNFSRFGMNLELKFTEVSRLEVDRI
jgi:hypothetical protein